MTRIELTDEFEKLEWVKKVESLTKQENQEHNETNAYTLSFLEVNDEDNTAVWRGATIYVWNEGLSQETAYFKDSYPRQTL